MTVLFFGSDAFSIPSLERVASRFELSAVVTAPDRPKGRGYRIAATPVKEWAAARDIPVLQPERLDTPFITHLKELAPELIVLVAYGNLLPRSLLEIPARGAVNVHPSLLPKYRGAAPMEWALLDGERETGITVIRMAEELDAGAILARSVVAIEENDNLFTLRNRLMHLSPDILEQSIGMLVNGAALAAQAGPSSYARRLRKEDGLLLWERGAGSLHNCVRALIEWPGAFTFMETAGGVKMVKIGETSVADNEGTHGTPGEILAADARGIAVACGKGILLLHRLQMEGKILLSAADFLRGTPLSSGGVFRASRLA